ncbi:unnamed protein product [Soboliphyme baturini]|uniref:Coronin n=1 Tax=Soboliphyme baturini TaxID=241478 RepID=A0A183ISC9_9BILA|nr:unnamed protein product [Soboliphyme baturini]
MQVVRPSKFRNVFCKPSKLDLCMDTASMPSEITYCAVNPKFIAFILENTNGYFMVVPLNKVGKIDSKFPVVEAHYKQCLKVAWYPFNDCFVASCSDDGTAKVWRVPEGGLQHTLTEPISVLAAHAKRVLTIVWHPTAQNVLLSAGDDLKIFIWDVRTSEPLIEIDGHPDMIWSVAFNYNGSLIITACRDRIIRVIEPRSGLLMQDVPAKNDEKIQKSLFLSNGKILTAGLTRNNKRLFSVRDESAIDNAIASEELDMNSGTVVPFYDADTGLLFVCGRGDSFVRYYEINDEQPFIHYINTYRSIDPQRSAAFMPKRGLNAVRNTVFFRIYKCISRGTIQVLHFYVPRWTKGFQDDLYPDTNGTIPAITSEEWINGKDADPVKVSA